MVPVLLVHGIWDTDRKLRPLQRALEAAGFAPVVQVEIVPNDGSATIEEMARQVGAAAERLSAETGAAKVDVVGFSMGALVARYWVQRLGGRERARRFVSISGPQRGTATAYFSRKPAVREMRFGSALLEDLARDDDPWGAVEVFALWTPFDVMVVPPGTAWLPKAREARFWVPLHAWMVTDARVLRAVVEALR